MQKDKNIKSYTAAELKARRGESRESDAHLEQVDAIAEMKTGTVSYGAKAKTHDAAAMHADCDLGVRRSRLLHEQTSAISPDCTVTEASIAFTAHHLEKHGLDFFDVTR